MIHESSARPPAGWAAAYPAEAADPHCLADGAGVPLPQSDFGLELGAPGAAQLIVLRPAIVLGIAPLGGEESVFLEAVEGGVEGPFFDEEVAVGDGLDPFGDGVAVAGAPGECFEDEDIERASEEAAVAVEHGYPSWLEGTYFPGSPLTSRG